ncbi:ABC transporter permease [Mucilaginibacter sp. BT774]|uniref:ABC transporter permease n=1 Tax=Mucilaginibacter sp. BT774 TaxID=3062276 RepID=UPI00267721FF|nr:ABC transporter permease [Mucilaginibacter sp. BT774]MDO3628068.1 ABC transporter permease [Mucilaginibacter sp. BT774]
MIKNYLKVAWRNLIKNRASSLINIGGLAVGMAVVMLIGLWIWDELSFDKYHRNYNRITQVVQNVTNNGQVQTWLQVPYPLAAELRKNYGSDFKAVVMSTGVDKHILALGDKKLTQSGNFMEPQGPEMFSLKMLQGNRDALMDPSSLLLSASAAKAFFGNSDPLDKMLKMDNQVSLKVAGVYEDLPKNSSLADMAFIGAWDRFAADNKLNEMKEPWRPNFVTLYGQLADNADLATVSLKIKDEKLRHVNAFLAKKKPALFLHPMSKWHLYGEFKNGINTGGSIQYVWLFGIIGVFVLLLACINFMNLSTARSEKRAREVGIRKAIGSLRAQLIYQFFCESLLCVFFALAVSLLLVQLSLSFFNQVAGKQMSIPWSNLSFWVMVVGFSLITGLITGSYPAFYLSSFKPIKVLKGSFRVGRFAAIPRKALVVLQFTVSVILIIGTIVVFRQIQFAKNRPVGYSRDRLVYMPMVTNDIHKHFEAVKMSLLNTGAISEIAEAGAPPIYNAGSTSAVEWEGKDPNLSVDFPQNNVSYEYGKTIGWQFAEGRDFSRSFLSDSAAVILNEAAVHFMGLKDPLNSSIEYYGNLFKIIGVAKDMIIDSPYGQVRPTVYFLSKDASSNVLIKINPKMGTSEAMDKIGSVFKTYNPAQPFEYHFVDQDYAKKFDNEERIGTLATSFAGLAIFISCLGLFGMASFMAEQRIKEIGVRKVLGASVFNLWQLLSKDFVILVLIALVIASPVAWYFMHSWLQNYDYHADMAWWIFIITGAGAMTITLLTVSFQSIKAALANPVKSLRSE